MKEIEKILQEESNRCLKCKNSPCKNGCPINTPIPEIITLFQNKEYEKAGEILFENNPMSLICSLVCSFESQCMGSCIRGIKGKSVDFPKIENFLMKKYLEENEEKTVENENKNKKIAVIGSGSAGLTGAFNLANKGYDVTVYDNNEEIGGMFRYGIPEFRLAKANIDLLEKKINDSYKFVNNTSFNIEKISELKNTYDAVLISTGTWTPKELKIEGMELEHVSYAIDYLKNNINFGKNKKVVVIGAGNVAMDAARTAKRQGNDVVIAYRRDIESSPATKVEIEDSLGDGIEFLTFVSPVKIVPEGIILERTYYDDNNKLQNIKNSQFLYFCNNVIIAVSQTSEFSLELLEKNSISNENGYFYAGDLVSGPETVVKASLSGKNNAKLIDNYLTKKGESYV